MASSLDRHYRDVHLKIREPTTPPTKSQQKVDQLKQFAIAVTETVQTDPKQTQHKIKTAAMGGSYCDSACRLGCTLVSLSCFCVIAFYYATDYRPIEGLPDCYSIMSQDVPVSPSAYRNLERQAVNVSRNWMILYYFRIGAASSSLMQIAIATFAFQTKERDTCCDKIVLPYSVLHFFFQTFVFFWCHVTRFNHAGQVCAGDFLSEKEFAAVEAYQLHKTDPSAVILAEDAKHYLVVQGLFLKWWIFFYWVALLLVACCCTCCCCYLSRLKPNV